MRIYIVLASVVLCSLQQNPAMADAIYRWADRQGQAHFSDTAPDGPETVVRIPQPMPSRLPAGKGLRTGEREALLQIQRRSQQQAKNAQTRGLQYRRKRAEQQERCETSRQKPHDARGREMYQQYSSYLRKHCW